MLLMKHEKEREEKQIYLRDSVVNAGLNADKFVEYLQSIRENGADIDVWELEELKEQVEKFKELNAPPTTPEESKESAKTTTTEELPQKTLVSSEPPRKISSESSQLPPLYKEELPKFVTTLPIDQNDLTNEKAVECIIAEPKTVDPGLFRSKYVVYPITTKPNWYSVERRYSDFDTLRQELLKHYPGYVVPPIPKKKTGKKLEPIFLEKRRVLLQEFLNDVLKHPILRSSELLMQFLSLPHKEWESKVKSMSKTPAPKEVAEFRTAESQANVELTKESEEYCAELLPPVKALKELYKELKGINHTIANDLERLSDSMSKAGAIYHKLSTTYASLGDKSHFELFSHMSEAHSRLGDVYSQTKDMVINQFVSFYTFYKHELASVEELLVTQKSAGEHMYSTEQKLWKKKEQRFEQKNIVAWELDPASTVTVDSLLKNKALAFQEMLPKETKEAAKLRTLYGYYTNKVMEEFTRLTKKNVPEVKNHFVKAAESFSGNAEQVKETWKDILGRINGVLLDQKGISEVLGNVKS